jgi:hypothetical protein
VRGMTYGTIVNVMRDVTKRCMNSHEIPLPSGA